MNKRKITIASFIAVLFMTSCGDMSIVSSASSAVSSSVSAASSVSSIDKAELAMDIFEAYDQGKVNLPSDLKVGSDINGSYGFKVNYDNDGFSFDGKTSAQSAAFKGDDGLYTLSSKTSTSGTATVVKNGESQPSYGVELTGKAEISDKTYFYASSDVLQEEVKIDKYSTTRKAYGDQTSQNYLEAFGISISVPDKAPALNLDEEQKKTITDFISGNSESKLRTALTYKCTQEATGGFVFSVQVKATAFALLSEVDFSSFLNSALDYGTSELGSLGIDLSEYGFDVGSMEFKKCSVNLPSSAKIGVMVSFDKDYLPTGFQLFCQVSDANFSLTFGSKKPEQSESSSASLADKTIVIDLPSAYANIKGSFSFEGADQNAVLSDKDKKDILLNGTDITKSISEALKAASVDKES